MYYLNRESSQGWYGGAKAVPYHLLKKHTPWEIKIYHLRHYEPLRKIAHAGWHFNTMGGAERSLYKWFNTGPISASIDHLRDLESDKEKLKKRLQTVCDEQTHFVQMTILILNTL